MSKDWGHLIEAEITAGLSSKSCGHFKRSTLMHRGSRRNVLLSVSPSCWSISSQGLPAAEAGWHGGLGNRSHRVTLCDVGQILKKVKK